MDYKEQDLNQIIFDFSLESKQRMKTLKLISIEKLPEIINRLISIHLFSNTSVVEEFLSEICLETKIPIIFRLQCSVLLCKKNTEKSFDILNKVLKNKTSNLRNDFLKDILTFNSLQKRCCHRLEAPICPIVPR